jgi:hypothetical protein
MWRKLRAWYPARRKVAWVRSIGIAVAAVVVAAVGGLACGGGEERAEVDLSDVDAVVASALEALSPAGQVLYLSGSIEEEGEARPFEIWIDADNERGRWETEYAAGLRGASVSDGWEVTTYDPWANAVDSWSMLDYSISEGYTGNPALLSVWYVWMIGSADELAVAGREKVRGHDAIVVNMAQTRLEDSGDQEASTDELRLVLDEQSLLPVEEEWRFVSTAGEETLVATISYEQAEYVSEEDLPADFFSPQAVEELAIPE